MPYRNRLKFRNRFSIQLHNPLYLFPKIKPINKLVSDLLKLTKKKTLNKKRTMCIKHATCYMHLFNIFSIQVGSGLYILRLSRNVLPHIHILVQYILYIFICFCSGFCAIDKSLDKEMRFRCTMVMSVSICHWHDSLTVELSGF